VKTSARLPVIVAGLALLMVVSPALSAGAAQNPAVSTVGVDGRAATSAGAVSTTDFGSCVAGGGSADILLLVDESSSLLSSDGSLARVKSATYLVDQLATYAKSGGLALDVQLSVFGDSYTTLVGWTGLDSSSIDSLHSGINSLATRVDGFDTDYWTALNGARNDLAARSAANPGTTRCQSIVWFTDGKLDYSPRTTGNERDAYGTTKVFAPGIDLTSAAAAAQIKESASSDLCRDGGLADQLRSSGVRLFGVLLNGSTSIPSDFDFIQSVIAGKPAAGGAACGRLIEPVPGEYDLATDIDTMLFAFDAFASPGSAPIAQSTGICQVTDCVDQTHPFVLDASTPDFHILATADVGGLAASLRLPDGVIVGFPKIPAGKSVDLALGGAALSYVWESDKTLSITVSQDQAPSTAWNGLWQLSFTDPTGMSAGKKSHSNVHISGSLLPALVSGKDAELHTGEVVSGLALGLVNKKGLTVDPASILGQITYTAVLKDNSGTSTSLLDAGSAAELDSVTSVDLTQAAIGPAVLTLSLGITTAGFIDAAGEAKPGTVLEPATVAIALSLLPPLDYPVVASNLDFGEATGKVALNAILPITGDGCAWIPAGASPTIIASPADLGKITIGTPTATTRETCFHAGSGEGIAVTLLTESAGNGTVNGSLPVKISPGGPSGDALEVTVSFTANLQKPLNSINFWIALLTALILGPGVPLLVLYFAKWLISKVPARPLAGTLIEVTVADGQVLRDGARFALGPADVRQTVAIDAGGARRLDISGVGLRTKLGWAPVGAGHVEVEAVGRSSASSADRSTDRSGITAVLPLAVHNHWVVLHAPGTIPADSVLVLIAGDATAAHKSDMENDINRRLPGVLAELKASESAFNGSSPTEAATADFAFAGTAEAPASSFTGVFGANPAQPDVPPPLSSAAPTRFGFGSAPEPDSDSGSGPTGWGSH
jgi:hypothetical protein